MHAGITHTRIGQQFGAANKCCLQFAHSTTTHCHRLFYSSATKAAIQMSQEYFYQGGLNNKCLTLYVGGQQASLTLTCLSTSTPTKTSAKVSPPPSSLLCAIPALWLHGAYKRAQCKKYASCSNTTKTKTDNRRQQQTTKRKKMKNSAAFPAAVNMANVRGSGLCKTQHSKRITDSMECSYFCHSFVLLCHLCKKSE